MIVAEAVLDEAYQVRRCDPHAQVARIRVTPDAIPGSVAAFVSETSKFGVPIFEILMHPADWAAARLEKHATIGYYAHVGPDGDFFCGIPVDRG